MLFEEKELEEFYAAFKADELTEDQCILMIIELAGRIGWGVKIYHDDAEKEEDEIVVGLTIGNAEFMVEDDSIILSEN